MVALEYAALPTQRPDAVERVAERAAVSLDTATRALREARDRIEWAASTDLDSIRAGWLAEVAAVGQDAVRRGRHEAGLAALELRARAVGLVAQRSDTTVQVAVGAGAVDAGQLAARLATAQAELASIAERRAALLAAGAGATNEVSGVGAGVGGSKKAVDAADAADADEASGGRTADAASDTRAQARGR